MASALQCPACGFKHRLSSLAGEPIFPCAQCGRLLKTPAEYRRAQPNGTAGPSHPEPAASAPSGASGARTGVPRGRRARRTPAVAAVPLRILAWVVAILLGAFVVRYVAKATGWITGDTLIDVITGRGWGRYLRVFALVPVWALVSAGLATAFIDGARWWSARRGAPRPPAGTGGSRRPPAPPARTVPRPSTPVAAPTAPTADVPQRERRIPRRDVTS